MLTYVNAKSALERSNEPATSQEIEAAVADAEARRWTFHPLEHLRRLFCAHADRDGCQVGVNGTPKDPEAHARQIRRAVDRCPHGNGADDENV
jgi:hypothetical protein